MAFIRSNVLNFLPFGPNPALIGDVQRAGTMCVVNQDFFFMDLEYKKGMQEGNEWARIVVEGVTTDKYIKHGFIWVEKANVEVTTSLVQARL
ncbi:hypothetical protein N0V91_004206 [Didymella pomorum]|uniref:Uncharacterized protein n=1 Tax=Didymella pomorum TaxID=749634 RepID=A0A9W8ZHS5_9PLEO|nr:hypothetical protein N0V91_004206 [Didymella pomorum]